MPVLLNAPSNFKRELGFTNGISIQNRKSNENVSFDFHTVIEYALFPLLFIFITRFFLLSYREDVWVCHCFLIYRIKTSAC